MLAGFVSTGYLPIFIGPTAFDAQGLRHTEMLEGEQRAGEA